LTTVLKIFEQRLDIILFRSNLTLNLDLARILVSRGYISINFLVKKNIAFQTEINDIISINNQLRNVINEMSVERYESFRKIYLNRFYKMPYFNIISKYIATIISTLKQMIGRNV
jgi:ribosomal protein S4